MPACVRALRESVRACVRAWQRMRSARACRLRAGVRSLVSSPSPSLSFPSVARASWSNTAVAWCALTAHHVRKGSAKGGVWRLTLWSEASLFVDLPRVDCHLRPLVLLVGNVPGPRHQHPPLPFIVCSRSRHRHLRSPNVPGPCRDLDPTLYVGPDGGPPNAHMGILAADRARTQRHSRGPAKNWFGLALAEFQVVWILPFPTPLPTQNPTKG